MAHDVFISYSSEDKTVSDAVCATLENRKIRCWIAPRDVTPGQPFAASLINAVKSARVMVLVLSEGSNQSQYVLRELNEAVDKGIPIIPFRIEDVEPSEELRFYIKSIHWLDAMNPPLERDLKKLAESVEALLSIGEEDQPPAAEPVYAVPARKRISFPLWAIALIGLAAVIVLGAVGIWVVPRLNSALSSPTSTGISAIASQTDTLEFGPTPSPELSSEPGWSDWRALSFNIPNDTAWSRTEDNTYSAFTGNEGHSIAWSDETFDGDLILSLDIGSTGDRASGSIIVYGDGIEYSNGTLIFTLSDGIFWVEKHTIYHEGENFLAVYESGLDFQDRIFAVRIEIVEDKANYFIDGEKVASFFIPSDIRRSGRIGISQHWEEPDDRTYSNIKIKTANAVSVVAVPSNTLDLEPSPSPELSPITASPPTPEDQFRVGFVTDTSGIDDKSFNSTIWNGILRAQEELGIKAQFLQSEDATQYDPNLTEFANQGYDLIIAAGFSFASALANVAANFPDADFVIIDFIYPALFGVTEGVIGYDECIPNVQGQDFKTDQAAFLAGYLAAGMSETGKIGVFGGAQIPTVTIFNVGFQSGMEHYNEIHDTNIILIGWDNETGEGLFTDDFSDLEKGKEAAEALFDQGVDIFMPVAGLVGSPGFDVARQYSGYGIWIDFDGYNILPEARDVMLTSVVKNINSSIYDVIKAAKEGNFQGCGAYIGDLANSGVSIAPYHDLSNIIPDSLKAEIEDLKSQILSGEITDTGCVSYPSHCPTGIY